ncbi:MAG: MFS transporter [Gammaproteobacteria bacterium]|nr:MFS transporter [Gammaproteobacteria bacterium]MDH5801442.1 MFS transporter [Gammaproteobacteria bacterium]
MTTALELWDKLTRIHPQERRAVAWSFLYFFCLLCSYYIIRPIRDEMGVQGGVDQLQWLFSATFVVMLAVVPLFGWLCSRFPRKRLLPVAYYFFCLNILLFFFLLFLGIEPVWTARAFFVWVSVFNLFVVSVFWSLMVDLYSDTQSKRLFGLIAAGGSLGAVCGPLITSVLVMHLGKTHLLLISAVLLLASVFCMKKLIRWYEDQPQTQPRGQSPGFECEEPMHGGLLAGIRLVLSSPYLLGICLLILLYTTLSTFLYFQQAQIVKDAFSDSDQRTAVFAAIDLAVNGLTLAFQVFFTGRLVNRFGLSRTLALVPLLLAAGLFLLGLMPQLGLLIVVQVVRRAGNYAIMRPAREMLYVVLDRESKYKAKNFIDTAVYRGGDAVSSWVYTGLKSAGLSLSNIAFLAVPLALVWAVVAYRLGRRQGEIAQQTLGKGACHE